MLTSQVKASRCFLDALEKSEHSAGAKRTLYELGLGEVTLNTLAPIKRPIPEWLLGESRYLLSQSLLQGYRGW
jgi:hypothetical protein